jgi:hypothetical protein
LIASKSDSLTVPLVRANLRTNRTTSSQTGPGRSAIHAALLTVSILAIQPGREAGLLRVAPNFENGGGLISSNRNSFIKP